MTKLLKINKNKINKKKILLAAKIIKTGGLVVFPTETVYGLGANIFDNEAIRKIYLVKKRPFSEPLIVHIDNIKYLYELAVDIPEIAFKLIKHFWPGPLTIILKKSKLVPDVVTASLNTVAIRMPKNKIALSLIKYSEVPIAAPSANISGYISTTKPTHVIDDLFGKVDVIIDAGKTELGLESTLLDLTSNSPKILRPGSITVEQLKKVIKTDIIIHKPKINLKKEKINNTYSSTQSIHYLIKSKLILVTGNNNTQINKIKKFISELEPKNLKIGLLVKKQNILRYGKKYDIKIIDDKNLFSTLREFDKQNTDIIISETLPEKNINYTIMDRLYKIAEKII